MRNRAFNAGMTLLMGLGFSLGAQAQQEPQPTSRVFQMLQNIQSMDLSKRDMGEIKPTAADHDMAQNNPHVTVVNENTLRLTAEPKDVMWRNYEVKLEDDSLLNIRDKDVRCNCSFTMNKKGEFVASYGMQGRNEEIAQNFREVKAIVDAIAPKKSNKLGSAPGKRH